MTSSSLETIRNAFTSICQQFQKSIEQGDLGNIGNLYTEDAKILPPNMDMLEGRDSIQAFWQRVSEIGIKSYQPEIIEVEYSGNLGFFVGKHTLYSNENQVVNKGKFITVF